jgi:hypothetical protein
MAGVSSWPSVARSTSRLRACVAHPLPSTPVPLFPISPASACGLLFLCESHSIVSPLLPSLSMLRLPSPLFSFPLPHTQLGACALPHPPPPPHTHTHHASQWGCRYFDDLWELRLVPGRTQGAGTLDDLRHVKGAGALGGAPYPACTSTLLSMGAACTLALLWAMKRWRHGRGSRVPTSHSQPAHGGLREGRSAV